MRAPARPRRSEAEVIAAFEAKEREKAQTRTEHADRGRRDAEGYAAGRGERAEQLTRAQAIDAARKVAPDGTHEKSRAYQQAFADRLVELGHAQPTSDGRRSGPSGKSGKGAPELRVRVPQADQDRYRAHADRGRATFADWVREALEEKADREDAVGTLTEAEAKAARVGP